jgi:large repetitive protein
MSLFFRNLYPSTVSVCVVFYDTTCPETPWRKAGWWNIAYGETDEIWNGTLQTSQLSVNWYFFASASDGAYWAGNPQVLVTDAAFDQCVSDNTGDTIQVGLRDVNINGYANFTVTLVGDSPWPMYHQNPARTGLSEVDTSGNAGQMLWTYNTNEEVVIPSPAIGVDGAIFIRGDQVIHAINPDGTSRWTFPYVSHEGVQGSPTVGFDGAIYVSGENLYAINPDGTLRWTFNTTNPQVDILSSPAIGSDGTIYTGSLAGNLYALNPDGSVRWTFDTGGESTYSPAIGPDGTIYVGGASHVYAVNSDGSLKWVIDNVSTGVPMVGPDGSVYAANGALVAINPDGTLKWSVSGSYSIPCLGPDGTIYAGNGGSLDALNPDGSAKWSFAAAAAYFAVSPPACGVDGGVYFGSGTGNIYALNPDGSMRWVFPGGGSDNEPAFASPVIGWNGVIYAIGAVGMVFALA